MSTIHTIGQHTLAGLEWLGTAAFALSGVLSAMRKRMDVVGVVVCGFLAAFDGGTLRDVLIDRRPFFWAEHQTVLLGRMPRWNVSGPIQRSNMASTDLPLK